MLAAATELLVEQGHRAVTVDAVAERSGVAKSTLYRHWDSRVALLVDVVRSNAPDITPPDPSLSFDESLRSVVHRFADAFADEGWAQIMPALFVLKQQIPEMAEFSVADHDEKLGVLRDVLDKGVAEGRIPAGLQPEIVANTVVGPLIASCMLNSADDLHALADYVVDRFISSYS